MPFAFLRVLSPGNTERPLRTAAKEALAYGLELYGNPSRHQMEGYRVGYGAYEWWIDAVKQGHGNGHGHWWNAVVWSECRRFAAEFFRELPEVLDGAQVKAPTADLAATYDTIAKLLNQAKERDMRTDNQVRLLTQARDAEHRAEEGLERLYAVL
jgi:hypothetical protein